MKIDNRGFIATRSNRIKTYGTLESLFAMFGQQTGFFVTEPATQGIVMKITQFADGRYDEMIRLNDKIQYYQILQNTKVIKYQIRFNATKLLLIEVNEEGEISSEIDKEQAIRSFADRHFLAYDHRGRKVFIQKAVGKVSEIQYPICRRLNQEKGVVVDSKVIKEAVASEYCNDHLALRFNAVTQTFDIKVPYLLRYQVREIFGKGIEFDYTTLLWHTDIENRERVLALVRELKQRYALELFD